MHILLTANSAWNIWNFRRGLVQALMNDGHKITVLVPPDEAVRQLEGLGCHVRLLNMNSKGINPLDNLLLTRQFMSIFRMERPDVILSYTIKNNIFGAMAARRLQILFIPNVTGLGTAFLSGRLMQSVAVQLYRWAFSELPVVFFQNEDDRKLFVKSKILCNVQGRVIPGSGIDLNKFVPAALPSNGAPVTFLMIARLLRGKGVYEFVAAARKIKESYPQARFQLLGALAAANRTAIEAKMVAAWVAEGVVEYLNTTDDVRPAIAASHCVVLPSYREGMPRTLIEAASMARPVITTNVPGCRSAVNDGVSGFLCDVKSADSLANSMQAFIDLSPDARSAMGLEGRKKMEIEFHQGIVVTAYKSAIDILTRGSGDAELDGWKFH